MAFEQRDNSGSMFVNSRKEKESHPDRQGSAKVVCPQCKQSSEFWLSGWIKDLKNKPGKWLSIAFEVKEDKPAEAPEFDDDIPF